MSCRYAAVCNGAVRYGTARPGEYRVKVSLASRLQTGKLAGYQSSDKLGSRSTSDRITGPRRAKTCILRSRIWRVLQCAMASLMPSCREHWGHKPGWLAVGASHVHSTDPDSIPGESKLASGKGKMERASAEVNRGSFGAPLAWAAHLSVYPRARSPRALAQMSSGGRGGGGWGVLIRATRSGEGCLPVGYT